MSNIFSANYYESILKNAIDHEYTFMTMRDYLRTPPHSDQRIAVLRHDIDAKPLRTRLFHEAEQKFGIVSTNFLLVHDINYNPFAINNLKLFSDIQDYGSEIGLHTNYVETAMVLSKSPLKVLESEILALRSHFDIYGVACHRNIDYMENSLPHLEEHWEHIKTSLNVEYQAYTSNIMKKLEFVNEGFTPHLGWRNRLPEQVISEGKSFCLSTHPHWWYKDYAFED